MRWQDWFLVITLVGWAVDGIMTYVWVYSGITTGFTELHPWNNTPLHLLETHIAAGLLVTGIWFIARDMGIPLGSARVPVPFIIPMTVSGMFIFLVIAQNIWVILYH